MAQSIDSNSGLRKQFIENNKDNRSVYGSAPINHINPSFNTITYALGLEFPNYTITPDTEDPSQKNTSSISSLKLTGWAARPHISISLRNIGLGFSIGQGAKKALYESFTTNRLQESKLEFREVGLFLYFVPFFRSSKTIRPTIVLGGQSITAKHSYTSEFDSSVTPQISRYSVNSFDIGINIRYQIFRKFGIVPWVDYDYTDTRSIELSARNKANSEVETQLENDLALFWHDKPSFRYGVDLVARFSHFEINLGGLLGSILTTANKKDSISDDGFTINLSLDQKGR